MPPIVLDRYRTILEAARGRCVLDIGCVDHDLGTRKQSRWLHGELARAALQCTGLDNDRGAIEQLKREGYDAVCADARAFDLGATYDLIVAGELIEHITDHAGFFSSARKHLKPGGALILTTPNATGLYYFLSSLACGHERENPDHTCFFTPGTLRAMLAKCGFRVVEWKYIIGLEPQGHRSSAARMLAWAKNIAKIPLYFVFRTLCHRFLVVASPAP